MFERSLYGRREAAEMRKQTSSPSAGSSPPDRTNVLLFHFFVKRMLRRFCSEAPARAIHGHPIRNARQRRKQLSQPHLPNYTTTTTTSTSARDGLVRGHCTGPRCPFQCFRRRSTAPYLPNALGTRECMRAGALLVWLSQMRNKRPGA